MAKYFLLINFIILFQALILMSCDRGSNDQDEVELEKSKKSQEIRASLDGDIFGITF